MVFDLASLVPHNLLNQFTTRPQNSTKKQGTKVCQVDTILLDFSKAFDRVPHSKLIEKLRYYGIRGPMLNWTKAFLTGRSQKVSVNGVHSSPIQVTSGVPQGSVLGPTLFLLYINDINNQVNSNVRLFADDSLLYRPIWSLKDHEILQKDLETLSARANKWQMSFNISQVQSSFPHKEEIPFSVYLFHGRRTSGACLITPLLQV